MDNKAFISITVIVLVLVAGGAGFWYWFARIDEAPLPLSAGLQENVGGGLGANIFAKSQNPIVDKLPETNPFEKIEINPLKAVYSNPFE